MKHYLTYKDDKSNKFWQIEINGNSFTVTYGKVGAAGSSQTKTFDSEEKCMKEASKLVSQKLEKGYIKVAKASKSTGIRKIKQETAKESVIHIKKGTTLFIQADSEKNALKTLVDAWNDPHGKIFGHPDYRSDDNIVELAFEIQRKKLNELKFFKKLSNEPQIVDLTKRFITSLTEHNKRHGTIYTNEELETGTFASEYLVKTDLTNLPLYIKFLSSIDLDHTVEQPSVVVRLSKIYEENELAPLFTFLQENGGQVFADWLKFKGSKSRQGALHSAVQSKNIREVRKILEQKEVNLNELDGMNGFSPLHYSTDSVESARLLVEAGADINCQTTKGETILHLCLRKEDCDNELLDYIIEAGADIYLKDNEGRSAIHHISSIEGLELVLKHGGRINDRDNHSKTLLHLLAPWNFEPDLFEAILENGGDPNAVDECGDTPLHVAGRSMQVTTVQILLEAGADPNQKNKDGESVKDIYPLA